MSANPPMPQQQETLDTMCSENRRGELVCFGDGADPEKHRLTHSVFSVPITLANLVLCFDLFFQLFTIYMISGMSKRKKAQSRSNILRARPLAHRLERMWYCYPESHMYEFLKWLYNGPVSDSPMPIPFQPHALIKHLVLLAAGLAQIVGLVNPSALLLTTSFIIIPSCWSPRASSSSPTAGHHELHNPPQLLLTTSFIIIPSCWSTSFIILPSYCSQRASSSSPAAGHHELHHPPQLLVTTSFIILPSYCSQRASSSSPAAGHHELHHPPQLLVTTSFIILPSYCSQRASSSSPAAGHHELHNPPQLLLTTSFIIIPSCWSPRAS
ncbi:unnamed protein product [Caenorhabditis bovis]|uniref:Uncharacterized protein n=1 Tax=Caenorhabditis bovis TaxID=2654633 RepID=A0A8S1EFP0_9PELO|nr:unnamed protein product [Caenorhabditis bovis]